MKPTCILILFFIFMLVGCAAQETAYIKDGKEYGVINGLFRDRWWNYYEKGLSFEEGEFYQEAIRDFEFAIQRRPDDQWRSRSYGMHFIDYFPHRELGIVYYKTRKYHEAVQELEDSLKTAESAKAKYFLNRARKAILDQSGADKESPDIRINYPSDATITNKFFITLNGEAEDDYFVSSLAVNDIPLPIELSTKKVVFDEQISLNSRMNNIKIQATDLTGKIYEKILKIEADREGPIIIIDDVRKNGRKVTLSGYLTDSTGITSFILNDKSIPIAHKKVNTQHLPSSGSGQELRFDEDIELPDDINTVNLKVEDLAQNVTQGEIDFLQDDYTMTDIQRGTNLNPGDLLALAYPSHDGGVPDHYAFIGEGLKKIFDDIPPEIHLKDLIDFQTVYTDSFFLEGSVSDKSKIVSLLINGESILQREGKKIFFSYLSGLKEGVNRFFIESKDAFDNKSEKMIAINRKIPKIREIGSRMSVSVLPLAGQGKKSVPEDVVFDTLVSAFVNQKRFQLVERKRIDEVLKELNLSQMELVDPDTAAKIGKIVAADAILTGSVYETENSIEILSRLVDTETSHIMEAKDVFSEDKGPGGIKKITEDLALKYKQSFPLLEGIVLKKEGNVILVDMGTEEKIKRDMSIILFREGDEIKHPVTGRILGSEPIELGEAKIEDVYKEFSRAVIKKGKPSRISIKDVIITK